MYGDDSMEMKLTLDKDKKPAIVVDVDGTIANIDERLERAREQAGVTEEEVADTRNFYKDSRRFVFFDELFNPQAMLQLDTPIEGSVEALNNLSSFFKIFYVTSRPKDDDDLATLEATSQWIDNNGYPDGTLIMRPRVMRKDAFFISVIAQINEDGYEVAFAIDDLFDKPTHYEAYGIRIFEVIDEKFSIPALCVAHGDNEICFEGVGQ